MSSLYPARRIPQGMILIGGLFLMGSLATAVMHFGFGVPVNNRDTGQPSSDLAIAVLIFAFGGLGVILALVGRAVLRAAALHHREQTSHTSGS